MSYEVLARKWRPQRFADVVGQEHVVATLSRAILANRVAHAYLLVGPRGTGKTTTARIFAKALNCRNRGDSAEPCGVCDSCREITAGTSLDVIEIDGASNNNVDQIRDLRDNVRYAPARGPFKIYIIDEVHMLSIGAFNALLKTLEEPPPHAKFLLATTDVHKVPVTILSRCQRFDLHRIGLREIVGRLREIATAEGWTVDDPALAAIARGAEGGLRDAESALDQIISFRGTTIAEQDVLDVFGLVSWRTIDELSAAILQNRPETILRILADLDEGGRDLQQLLKELAAHVRNLLVHLYAPSMDATFDLTPPQLESIHAQAALSDGEKLLRVMDILSDAAAQLRFSLARRATLEVALLKAARAASLVSIDELIARVQSLPGALPFDAPGGTPPVAPAPPPPPPAQPVAAPPPSVVSEPPPPPSNGQTVQRSNGQTPPSPPSLHIPRPKPDPTVRRGDPNDPLIKMTLDSFDGKLLDPAT